MQYTVQSVNGHKVGDITFHTGGMGSVTFEKSGGTLSAEDIKRLSVYKVGDKWAGIFLRAVTSGRIKITGDVDLEAAYQLDVPPASKPTRRAPKPLTAEDIQQAQAKLAEMLEEFNAATAKPKTTRASKE